MDGPIEGRQVLSYDELVIAYRRREVRQEIWRACVGVATTIGGEPLEQSADAIEIYNAALCIAKRRYGDEIAVDDVPPRAAVASSVSTVK